IQEASCVLFVKIQPLTTTNLYPSSPVIKTSVWTRGTLLQITVVKCLLFFLNIGGVVQLHCQIRGDPKPFLEWILPDGSKVRAPYSSEDRRLIMTAEGMLTLRGADASETGLYRCIATNYLDADILAFRVTVLSPDVEEAEVNVEFLLQEIPFISPSGITVPVKGRMGKFEVLSNGTLSIQNANIKDRGQYLCLANNDHGSDKLIVTLSVVAYPSRILEPKMRDIKSHTGNNVEMTCKAEGRPTPMISWILANQTQFRGQNTDKGRVSVSAVGTLVIEQVSVYDRGHYKCIASNPAGADTATVRLCWKLSLCGTKPHW
uniref:Ig-like domain-containing protein n=1 Tax=Cyclopterus lumpus TaxID=8103 RepID=A0A8C2WE87_CYCLU